MLYRESQKIPISSPRLAGPTKLGLALSGAPAGTAASRRRVVVVVVVGVAEADRVGHDVVDHLHEGGCGDMINLQDFMCISLRKVSQGSS